jgi:hypothetical protein
LEMVFIFGPCQGLHSEVPAWFCMRHRKYKRHKLGGGQAYNCSND